jgi:formylglycine-generating enzyme required for sulfatase activity
VETFERRLTGGEQVVVFYAGHGVEIKTGNYLLPIDIEVGSDFEIEKTALGLNDLTDKLGRARTNFSLVMVDACRDDPLKASYGRSTGGSRGLAPIDPPRGQMVVYSASKGQRALDQLSDTDANPNGVFMREFIARMRRPGVRIEDLMREVQESVETLARSVNREQTPAIYSQARGNFYFFEPTGVQARQPVQQARIVPPALLPTTPTPTKATGISLEDLEKEEATRRQWADWQKAMKADFDKTNAFAGAADLQVKAWERFLANWAQDNPLSKDDEALREWAREKVVVASLKQKAPSGLSGAVVESTTARLVNSDAGRPVDSTTLNPMKHFRDCEDCPEMVVIPSGDFQMGGSKYKNEWPIHRVNIRSFAMGVYEVTQGQWKSVMGSNPSRNSNLLFTLNDYPVENVSMEDVQKYIQKLNGKTGQLYRLPSEAEWEYATRGGTNTNYWWGDEALRAQANYGYCCDFGSYGFPTTFTKPVGQFKPNPFGLHDVHGNVDELVEDYYHDAYVGAPNDGSAWISGGDQKRRVCRGGSYYHNADFMRAATRMVCHNPTAATGFRIARSLP